MTAAFSTGAGSATPFVGRGSPALASPQGGRAPDEASRKSIAADAILRAAGAVTTGEA